MCRNLRKLSGNSTSISPCLVHLLQKLFRIWSFFEQEMYYWKARFENGLRTKRVIKQNIWPVIAWVKICSVLYKLSKSKKYDACRHELYFLLIVFLSLLQNLFWIETSQNKVETGQLVATSCILTMQLLLRCAIDGENTTTRPIIYEYSGDMDYQSRLGESEQNHA